MSNAGRLMGAGKAGKLLLGGTAPAVATLVLNGADHSIETALVASSRPG